MCSIFVLWESEYVCVHMCVDMFSSVFVGVCVHVFLCACGGVCVSRNVSWGLSDTNTYLSSHVKYFCASLYIWGGCVHMWLFVLLFMCVLHVCLACVCSMCLHILPYVSVCREILSHVSLLM